MGSVEHRKRRCVFCGDSRVGECCVECVGDGVEAGHRRAESESVQGGVQVGWLGIVIAVPALWLVAHTGTQAGPVLSAAALDGLIAGLGIAVQYVALAQAGAGSGLWPVAAGRVAAILTIAPLLPSSGGAHIRWSLVPALAAGFTGAAAALALIAYLLAAREQLAVVAVVVSYLYPVVPVLLGVTVLGERPHPETGSRVTRRRVRGHPSRHQLTLSSAPIAPPTRRATAAAPLEGSGLTSAFGATTGPRVPAVSWALPSNVASAVWQWGWGWSSACHRGGSREVRRDSGRASVERCLLSDGHRISPGRQTA
ncbi:conserved hypothetical protein [Rhodococcus jostii RHA1]|uniref:EamA domain-containing protein n=1 Tax=Rhodococcus jostii (strain RHA1) TaxID=101510 RepID=Q0SD18_RHOJR|nr:DMT family transporter [Rhodococcus jostii]ABG94568.1 conserved hypothetical protein [Rhodococcus jostii RHA1]